MKYLKKIGAITISAVMTAGMISGAGSISYAAGKIEKEETVYVNQKADGSVENVIVSDWLKNVSGTGNITDVSNLENIENVKGDENFQQSRDGKLIWNAQDADIYYQGTTNEELPVSVRISYKLDGVDTVAEQMAGKNGKVTLTIQYVNNTAAVDKADGEDNSQDIPFLMASAFILPVDTFRNVTVSQGKILSEGSNQIVVVYGMPGLAEELSLSSDMKTKLNSKMADIVTITADVRNFTMGSIYTVASSNVFSEVNLEADSSIEDLEKAMDDLAFATDELLAGSEELSDGLTTLQESFKTYAAGVSDADDGASDLSKGAAKLKAGISQYTEGVKSLTDGTSLYITGTQDLTEGVNNYVAGEKLIDAGITELYNGTQDFPAQYGRFSEGLLAYISGVNEIANEKNANALAKGSSEIVGGIQTVYDTLSSVNAGYANYDMAIDLMEAIKQDESLSEDSIQKLEQAILLISQTKNQQTAATAGIMQATGENSELAQGAHQLAAALQQLGTNAPKLIEGGENLKIYNSQINGGITGIAEGVSSLYAGSRQLSAGNDTLLAGAAELAANSEDLTAGIGQIVEGSLTLTTSADALSNGAEKLSKGMGKLESATHDVSIGVDKLQGGSISLTDGMNQFKIEGTGKIKNEYDNNIKTVIQRFRTLITDADTYKNFSGIADGMEGEVKFIFQTAEITSKKDSISE